MQKHYSFDYSYEAVVSPEEADEGAGLAEHEGDREGDGEEYVLVGDVGVDAAVVDHEQRREYRYTRHQDGRDAEGVERAQLEEHTLGVEEQEPEPVRGEHGEDAEGDQQRIENRAGEERAPDRGVQLGVPVVEQLLRGAVKELPEWTGGFHRIRILGHPPEDSRIVQHESVSIDRKVGREPAEQPLVFVSVETTACAMFQAGVTLPGGIQPHIRNVHVDRHYLRRLSFSEIEAADGQGVGEGCRREVHVGATFQLGDAPPGGVAPVALPVRAEV